MLPWDTKNEVWVGSWDSECCSFRVTLGAEFPTGHSSVDTGPSLKEILQENHVMLSYKTARVAHFKTQSAYSIPSFMYLPYSLHPQTAMLRYI